MEIAITHLCPHLFIITTMTTINTTYCILVTSHTIIIKTQIIIRSTIIIIVHLVYVICIIQLILIGLSLGSYISYVFETSVSYLHFWVFFI